MSNQQPDDTQVSSAKRAAKGTALRVFALLATALAVAGIMGFVFWLTAGGGAWRGSVAISEASFRPPNTLEVIVGSCNGAPAVKVFRQTADTVELEVVAYSTPLRGGDDCLDLLAVEVDEPFTAGDLLDLESGATIDITR